MALQWLSLLIFILLLQYASMTSQELCSAHETEISILKEQIEGLHKDLVNIAAERFGFEKRVGVLKLELDRCNFEVEKAMNNASMTRKTLNSVKQELKESDKTMSLLEAQNIELKEDLKAMIKVISLLKSINEDLRQDVEPLSNKLGKREGTEDKNKTETSENKSQTTQKTSPTFERILLLATRKGDVMEIKRILDMGINISVKDDSVYRRTPLLLAAVHHHKEAVQVLLDRGADLNETSWYLDTALQEAAAVGDVEICLLLLEKGATLDTENRDKNTPLHLAAQEGHLKVVQLLVEKGAEVKSKNIYSKTPNDLAKQYKHKDISDYLEASSAH